MPISYNGQSSTNAILGAAGSVTFAHDASTESNRALIVGLAIRTAASTGTSVTYAGVDMTRIAAANKGIVARNEMWYLYNPATGTNNVVANISGGTKIVAGAMSFYDVDTDTAPTATTASATSITPKISRTKTADDSYIVGTLAYRNSSTTYTIVSGTQTYSNSSSSSTAGANTQGRGMYNTAGVSGSSVLLSGTFSTSREWVHSATEIFAYNPPSVNQGHVIKAFK